MSWRDMLTEDQYRRLHCIETYHEEFCYARDSDQYLICEIAKWFDIKEENYAHFMEMYKPWWMKIIESRSRHVYTCRLFRRVDWLWYWLILRKPRWAGGRLVTGFREPPSIIPLSWYRWASDMQNKHYWTRLILDL